jgi:hypothetical protein
MGPGTIAAETPMVNPRTIALRISIMIIRDPIIDSFYKIGSIYE